MLLEIIRAAWLFKQCALDEMYEARASYKLDSNKKAAKLKYKIVAKKLLPALQEVLEQLKQPGKKHMLDSFKTKKRLDLFAKTEYHDQIKCINHLIKQLSVHV